MDQNRENSKKALSSAESGDWDNAIRYARLVPRNWDIWQQLPSVVDGGIPQEAVHKLLDVVPDSERSSFLVELAGNLKSDLDMPTLKRIGEEGKDEYLVTKHVTEHPNWKLESDQDLNDRTMASSFWHSYENKVDPRHFATVKSLFTNKDEKITDHRGKSGQSEPWNAKVLPIHAKAVQDAILKDKDIEKRFFKNKPHVFLYRGVGGEYAKKLREAVGHNPETHEVTDKKIRIPTAHLTSWTTDKEMAQRFATSRGDIGDAKGHGIVIGAWHPLENILHSGFHDVHVGQQHAHENESEIVIGHKKGNFVASPKNMEFEDNGKFHKFMSEDDITRALGDSDNIVRRNAIRHPKATPEHITRALGDSNANVRLSAIQHPNVTPEHITRALGDSDIYVRGHALRHLKEDTKGASKSPNQEVSTATFKQPSTSSGVSPKDLKQAFGNAIPKIKKVQKSKVLEFVKKQATKPAKQNNYDFVPLSDEFLRSKKPLSVLELDILNRHIGNSSKIIDASHPENDADVIGFHESYLDKIANRLENSVAETKNTTTKPELKLQKGAAGDWQKEGHTISHELDSDGTIIIKAKHPKYGQSGSAVLEPREDVNGKTVYYPGWVGVEKYAQRKGLATGMLDYAKKIGLNLDNTVDLSGDGKQFAENYKKIKSLEKGMNGDWQKEGYTFKHSPDAKNKYEFLITAHTPDGKQVGSYRFWQHHTSPHHIQVQIAGTHPNHQRKGLANAAYQLAEKITGKKLDNDSAEGSQSEDAKKLWSQPNRPFGKSSLQKSSSIPEIASIAIIDGDKILFGKRRDTKKYTLPGGHIEKGETPKVAAIRELREETGINNSDLRLLGTETVTCEDGKQRKIHAFVGFGKAKTTTENDPDNELSEFVWVDTKPKMPDNIMNNLHSKKNVTLKLLGLQKWTK